MMMPKMMTTVMMIDHDKNLGDDNHDIGNDSNIDDSAVSGAHLQKTGP